ncbi:unnamed protein product [Prunus armeniaca]
MSTGSFCLRACPVCWDPPSARATPVRWNVEMGLGHLLPGPNPATRNALTQAVKNINWADPNKFNPAHFIMGGQN